MHASGQSTMTFRWGRFEAGANILGGLAVIALELYRVATTSGTRMYAIGEYTLGPSEVQLLTAAVATGGGMLYLLFGIGLLRRWRASLAFVYLRFALAVVSILLLGMALVSEPLTFLGSRPVVSVARSVGMFVFAAATCWYFHRRRAQFGRGAARDV